jgi:hypothetical protein
MLEVEAQARQIVEDAKMKPMLFGKKVEKRQSSL